MISLRIQRARIPVEVPHSNVGRRTRLVGANPRMLSRILFAFHLYPAYEVVVQVHRTRRMLRLQGLDEGKERRLGHFGRNRTCRTEVLVRMLRDSLRVWANSSGSDRASSAAELHGGLVLVQKCECFYYDAEPTCIIL